MLRRVGVRARAGSVPNPRPSLARGLRRTRRDVSRPACPRDAANCSTISGRPSARSTCSPIPISPRATRPTGPDASGVALRPSCGRATSTRSPVSCARATRRASQSCPRAATPASSEVRFRCAARSSCRCAASTRLGPVDGRAAQVTAGAGATLAAVQAHARAAGWEYGVDLGARDSATIGGNIATNAGGVHVLRHGPTRQPGASECRPCSPTATSSNGSTGSRRTTPATT